MYETTGPPAEPQTAGPEPQTAGPEPQTAQPPAAGLQADPSRAAADGERALAAAADELDAVQRMLARLDDGSFDACEVCGGPIGTERLREQPLLTRCATHGPSTATPPAEPLERPVAVLAGRQPLPLGGQQPQG